MASLPNNPDTPVEKYVAKIAGQDVQVPEHPGSRVEQYLAYIAENGTGGGGTTDYNKLNNLPTLNSVPITGNKQPSDYGLATSDGLSALAAETQNQIAAALLSNVHHYGVRWDKTTSQMIRTGNAAGITTNTVNFKHSGSVNQNYDNPFDTIYPWNGVKLCNIDVDLYRALMPGESLRDCVVAWEGDEDFSYSHPNGVWKYTPEFWGTSYEKDGYRYFDICDKPVGGYVYYPEQVTGRWRGRMVSMSIGENTVTGLLPTPGMPCKRVAVSAIHTYANNWGATLDSIYSLDGAILMYLVEYANFNCQTAIGNGVNALYHQSGDLIQEESTGSVVKVLASAGSATCIPGAIFDIGTADGGAQVGSYYILAVETNGSMLNVTLNAEVSVTTEHFWSVHGLINIADEEIGSMSGYIGTNGKCDAYYRGEVLWGDMFYYVLGAYKSTEEHVWLAENDAAADNYNALNTAVHLDTGIVLAGANGYIKTLEYLKQSGKLSAPCFCTEIGGSSSAPVGDYFGTSVGNARILLVGGTASYGAPDGLFCWYWSSTASSSSWFYAGRPRLKSP